MLKKFLKIIVELVVFILLILTIIYLVISENGIISNISRKSAKEKLDEAIRIFISSEGITLKDSINNIEGLEKLDINEEIGEYNIRINGQNFVIINKELIPEDSKEQEKKDE